MTIASEKTKKWRLKNPEKYKAGYIKYSKALSERMHFKRINATNKCSCCGKTINTYWKHKPFMCNNCRKKHLNRLRVLWQKKNARRHSILVIESQKRYKSRARARRAVFAKIKSNKMVHPSKLRCMDCGKKAQEYDHANGYDKENKFNVDPVCHKCHVKRGVNRKEYSGGRPRRSGLYL